MPKYAVSSIITLFIWVLFLSAAAPGLASDDGYGKAQEIKGEYFTICYPPDADLNGLIQTLNIQPADMMLSGRSAGRNSPSGATGLAEQVDALFLYISDLLDIHVYSFTCTIKICRDSGHLDAVCRNIFKRPHPGSRSMYVSDRNTIYISPESFTREILGHEIAHAITCRYFVVQPPERVAEILSGYVEYQLRKSSRAR